jgi:hypothetical protein
MPLLKLQSKPCRKPITVKLASPVIEDLKAYAKFANSSINEVAQEALSYVFSKDAQFREWKEQQCPAPSVSDPASKGNGKALPPSPKSSQQPLSR